MNNRNLNNQSNPNPLLKLVVAVIALYALNEPVFTSNDPINYTLWHRNCMVYHGVCYADCIQQRLNEHKKNGAIYDEYDHDQAKPREKAGLLKKGSSAETFPGINTSILLRKGLRLYIFTFK